MQTERLLQYADLLADVGLNIQPGQQVIIVAGLDQPEFVYMTVEACYRHGAKRVTVEWRSQETAKLDAAFQTLETMSEFIAVDEAKLKYRSDIIPCRLFLDSEDPDAMAGVDQEKMAKARQARYPHMKPYLDALENKDQWCIAAVPGKKWAKKLFPDSSDSEAIEKLWEAILFTSRVTDAPVQEWHAHNRDLEERCAYLNKLGICQLHYTSSNGTDLWVGMIPQAEFKGGGEKSMQGIFFNPNIPTEECFISPDKSTANGIVYASKPLSYESQLIDGFWIRFENGRAVEWHAERNEALLSKMIQMDEGSAFLGECALVPYDSPIQKSGLLFYNTLFDENAACHLALGRGFADTIRGFEHMTLEDCRKLGINDSMIHVDFMIGTEDLSIDAACADGNIVPIFRNGNWAF